jgi:hypothetical protein
MLVYGTCNPEGYGDESYEGLYLTDADIHDMVPHMKDVPVKVEHRGSDVGKVVTAWVHKVKNKVFCAGFCISLLLAFAFCFVLAFAFLCCWLLHFVLCWLLTDAQNKNREGWT